MDEVDYIIDFTGGLRPPDSPFSRPGGLPSRKRHNIYTFGPILTHLGSFWDRTTENRFAQNPKSKKKLAQNPTSENRFT